MDLTGTGGVRRRQLQLDQVEVIKRGRIRTTRRDKQSPDVRTITRSVTFSVECLDIIHRWELARNAGRSEIVRQALRIADAEWSKQRGE
ncbi:MAG TPA: hypothetical protein VFD92_04700 [Candidatus Binatia bacterium]|nr:hypothetical protein [Candidatus Binatia bacterium]